MTDCTWRTFHCKKLPQSLHLFRNHLKRSINRLASARRLLCHSQEEKPIRHGRCGLFATFPPPNLHDIIAHFEEYVHSSNSIRYARAIFPDTPLLSLYRLYDFMMLDHQIGMSNEIEYFYLQHTWKVKEIPDPMDADATRSAALAAITAELVAAFNNKIGLGLPRDGRSIRTLDEFDECRNRRDEDKDWEVVPAWAKTVPPLKHTLLFPTRDGPHLHTLESKRASPAFAEKNIILRQPGTFFM